MLIGLNGQMLLIDNPAGAEKYTYNIYNWISKIDDKNNYIIYFSKVPTKEYFSKLTNNNPNFSFKVLESKISWTQEALSKELFKDNPDIFFTPVHTLPILRPNKPKYISMIHGLEYKHVDAKNPITKLSLGQHEKYVCKNSDLLIVPSQGTKDAILNKGWAKDKKIKVVYEGVSEEFHKRSEEEILNVRKKYKLNSNDYFVFIGTLNPRKNLPFTIESFSLALKQIKRDKPLKLAMVGKLGEGYEESLETPKKYGIDKEVFYLGRVPDEDLPALISGAIFSVNLSLEEGFGLPLLESMACETPCLVSNIPPYKEVASEYALFVDPSSVQSAIEGFNKMINLKDSNDKDLFLLISNAKKRASQFTWEESAKKTLDIFQSFSKNL